MSFRVLTFRPFVRSACAAFVALAALTAAPDVRAQQPIAGHAGHCQRDPRREGIVSDVRAAGSRRVEQAKSMFLQTNPNLSEGSRRVCAQSAQGTGAAQRRPEGEIAKIYASRFTEQELKETLAFYKSPLGKKLLTRGAAIRRTHPAIRAGLGQSTLRRSDQQVPRRDEEEGPQSAEPPLSGSDGRPRSRSVRHRRRLRRRARGAHCRQPRRQGDDRGGIPDRRHLRDPRLRAEEAPGLCLALCRRFRGRHRLWLDHRSKPLFDWPTLIANKDLEIARLEAAYRTNLERANVAIVETRAVLEDAHQRAADRQRRARSRQACADRHRRLAAFGRADRRASSMSFRRTRRSI